MLEADGLMVFYENMLALNNVSIQCEENQIVGVFGANSAGKSSSIAQGPSASPGSCVQERQFEQNSIG